MEPCVGVWGELETDLKGIVERSEPRAISPCHDVPLLQEEGSLSRKKETKCPICINPSSPVSDFCNTLQLHCIHIITCTCTYMLTQVEGRVFGSIGLLDSHQLAAGCVSSSSPSWHTHLLCSFHGPLAPKQQSVQREFLSKFHTVVHTDIAVCHVCNVYRQKYMYIHMHTTCTCIFVNVCSWSSPIVEIRRGRRGRERE